jgi:hypothetical protein
MLLLSALAMVQAISAAEDKLPVEIVNKLSTARLLPAPYSALMMLRVAKAEQLSVPQRAAIARDAYAIAIDSHIRTLPAHASLQEGTASEWLARWDFSALDPNSIALEAYIAHRDNAFKPDLELLPFPARKPSVTASCSDLYVNDPYDYFDIAVTGGDGIYRKALQTAHSAVEAGRAMGSLFELTAAERRTYAPLVLNLLATTPNSDREFGYAMRRTPLHNAILRIAGEGNRVRTLTRYREFLIRNFAQTRCADNASSYKGIIDEFNRAVRALAVPPIELEDGVGKLVDPATKFEPNLSSGAAFALRDKVGKLVMDETHVNSVMREVEDYQPSNSLSAVEGMVAKSYFHAALFEKLKRSPWADRALRSWVRYVAYGPAKREAPALWYACARTLADWAYNSPARTAEVESSGDPALAALLQLDPPKQTQ